MTSTTKQIKALLNDLATRHKFINTFHFGKDEDLGASSRVVYPALAVNPTQAEMIQNEEGRYKTIEHTFDIKVLDMVGKDKVNEVDVESDTLQILTEVVNELVYNLPDEYIIISGDIRFEPLDEFGDDEVDGWGGEITIKTQVNNTNCYLPYSA